MNHRRNDTVANDVARPLPTVCPACRSSAIATAAKQPNADSYWRCDSCGEVWNDSRKRDHPTRRTNSWR
jgi:predicted Zn finger-like uncharacterized protein